ncbi:hypothetical protein F5B21DRAFT_137688 [Xylaria acuta]|nr:hypothetical protein F5B21DRAFT_137688 [Xylaria acuta]
MFQGCFIFLVFCLAAALSIGIIITWNRGWLSCFIPLFLLLFCFYHSSTSTMSRIASLLLGVLARSRMFMSQTPHEDIYQYPEYEILFI